MRNALLALGLIAGLIVGALLVKGTKPVKAGDVMKNRANVQYAMANG